MIKLKVPMQILNQIVFPPPLNLKAHSTRIMIKIIFYASLAVRPRAERTRRAYLHDDHRRGQRGHMCPEIQTDCIDFFE